MDDLTEDEVKQAILVLTRVLAWIGEENSRPPTLHLVPTSSADESACDVYQMGEKIRAASGDSD
jgi:hypothetical protein